MGDRQALLSDLYEAYNRKDIEAVVAALHPEIDWPALFSEGRIQGAEAVRQLFTEPFKVMNPEITPSISAPTRTVGSGSGSAMWFACLTASSSLKRPTPTSSNSATN